MLSTELLELALSGQSPPRVPTLPKIWVDLGAKITGTGLDEVIASPEMAMRVPVDAACTVRADAARLFHFPARRVQPEADGLIEVDQRGRKVGRIDLLGGLATLVSDPRTVRLEDPYTAAFIQFWRTETSLVHSLKDVQEIAVPGKSFYEDVGLGKLQRSLIEEVGGKTALIGDCGSATLAFHILLRGLTQAMFDLMEDPRVVHAIMDKGVAHAIEKGKFNIDCGLRILRLNDSPANMRVISPGTFREFIAPRMKTICGELHRYEPRVKIYCHICGNVFPILEDLIDTGLDCIGPLDPLGGFSCADVRKVVGDRVALMGGINTLSFVNSTPEEIFQEAAECIAGAGPGGFVLGSGCVVPRDANTENLLALSDASGHFSLHGRARSPDSNPRQAPPRSTDSKA